MNSLKETKQSVHSRSGHSDSLRQELKDIHQRILVEIPDVARIAIVSYDPKSTQLYTYAESNTGLNNFTNYSFPLNSCPKLKVCAEQRCTRIVDDLPGTIEGGNKHSEWLLQQGYNSSYTVPIYNGQNFIGFIFFDSYRKAVFTDEIQQNLSPFCDLINFAVNTEYSLLNAILTSAEITKALSAGYKNESKEHMERMSRYAHLIAKGVADIYHLDDELIESVHIFSRLHDIGKSALSIEILLKPSPLAVDEREKMRDYISSGVKEVDKIIENLGFPSHRCIEVLKSIVSCHQEFLDGTGYPNGLSDVEIAVPARIVTVANVFDALTSHRPYKQACSVSAALLELEKMVYSGKLDGHCVNALREHQDYLADIVRRYPESDPSL